MNLTLRHAKYCAGAKVVTEWGRYANGRAALELLDRETGEPWCTATVNLVGEPLAPNEVCIKDYSENEGVVKDLVAAGLLHAPHRYVPSGFVSIPVCRLTALGEAEARS